MRYLLWIAPFLLIINQVKAIDKYQITVNLSPSMEHFNDRTIGLQLPNQWKASYHFGFEYRRFLDPNFSVHVGLNFQNKGFKTEPFILLSTGQIAPDKAGHIIVSARYLTIPLGIDKHFQLAKKLDLVLTTSFAGGRLVNQTMVGRRFDGPEDLEDPLFGRLAAGSSNIHWYGKYYLGANIGIGLAKYIKSKLLIVVQPMYQRQLNNALDPDGPIIGTEKPRLDSFSLDIKVGYYFNKQIKNNRKNL